MRIAGVYPFNDGDKVINERYPHLVGEIESIIASVDASLYKIKASIEKTMPGRMLYSPVALNNAFKKEFSARGWKCQRVYCE